MRRVIAAAILVAAFAAPAFLLRARAADTPAPITVTGTLIDTRCYSLDPIANKGADHKTVAGTVKQCARACASSGIPVALLDGDKVLILIAPSNALAPHMGKEARVTGVPVYQGALRPSKLEVRKGAGWSEVNLAVMM